MRNVDKIGVMGLTVFTLMVVLSVSSLQVSFPTLSWAVFGAISFFEVIDIYIDAVEKMVAYFSKKNI